MTDFPYSVPRTPSTAETIAMVDAEWCARLQKANDKIARLKRREAELLEANSRYLQRARDAEAGIKRRDEQIFRLLGLGHNEAAELRRTLADADAATIAMEAKVIDLERTISRAHAILDQASGAGADGTLDKLCRAIVSAWRELGGDAGPKRGG